MLLAALAAAQLASPARGADIRRAWRFSVAVGSFATRDEVRSDSANTLSLVDAAGLERDRFVDPRPDALATGRLQIQGGQLASFSVQYGLTERVLLEGSLGWERADVGDIEVYRVPFTSAEVPLATSRIGLGQLTRHPVGVRTMARFRSQARIHPYVAGGVGYSFVSLETSDPFETLSQDLDGSAGRQVRVVPASQGSFLSVFDSDPIFPLTGAKVEADDAFEWQLAGGAEYSFGSHWSGFVELANTFSSGSIEVGFNGASDLGIAVPAGTAFVDSPAATTVYGPIQITTGGLIDVNGDGVPDPGVYYVQGGSVSYDALVFRLGARFTF